MNYLRLSMILLAMAVVNGAFGAHTLKNHLSADQLNAWHTAVEYQFYHALGLLILSLLPRMIMLDEKRLSVACHLLFFGIILFSGSIYLLSTSSISGLNFSWLGPVTPLGGICFIAGWLIASSSIIGGAKAKSISK